MLCVDELRVDQLNASWLCVLAADNHVCADDEHVCLDYYSLSTNMFTLTGKPH